MEQPHRQRLHVKYLYANSRVQLSVDVKEDIVFCELMAHHITTFCPCLDIFNNLQDPNWCPQLCNNSCS